MNDNRQCEKSNKQEVNKKNMEVHTEKKVIQENSLKGNIRKSRLGRFEAKKMEISKWRDEIKLLEEYVQCDVESKHYTQILEEVINFQDFDGSFKVIDTYKVPSDIRVDFCHYPTCLCTAILIRAYTKNHSLVDETKFALALDACCHRGLLGHGYEGLKWQIDVMKIFINSGLKEFLEKYPNKDSKFVQMIYSVIESYKKRIKMKNYAYFWNENYEADISFIADTIE